MLVKNLETILFGDQTFNSTFFKQCNLQLRKWAKEKLPKYAIPSMLHVMDTLPRSVGGTVNKKELVDVAFPISTIH